MIAAAAHQCLSGRGGTVPCGAVGFWVTTVLVWAFGLIGALAIVVTLWDLFTRRRR